MRSRLRLKVRFNFSVGRNINLNLSLGPPQVLTLASLSLDVALTKSPETFGVVSSLFDCVLMVGFVCFSADARANVDVLWFCFETYLHKLRLRLRLRPKPKLRLRLRLRLKLKVKAKAEG